MNDEELIEELEKFAISHKLKIDKPIRKNKLYAECIYGHKHYIKSYEEYVFAIEENSILFIYGL